MEAAVNSIFAKYCKKLRSETRAKMESALTEAYDAGKDSAKPPEGTPDFRWKSIRDEQPPVGVKVVGRRRGKWTNLVMRIQEKDCRGNYMDVYHSGNSIYNWMPDEWFPLPV